MNNRELVDWMGLSAANCSLAQPGMHDSLIGV
jgi:hypothetical protein